MGRSIRVEVPKNRSYSNNSKPKFFSKFGKETTTPESCNVIVRNLPFSFVEDQLYSNFESCGSIRRARVIVDGEGNSRGFGFVDFYDIESAKKAISKSGEKFGGRPIHVDYSIPREKR